jgi:hypothetical protein
MSSQNVFTKCLHKMSSQNVSSQTVFPQNVSLQNVSLQNVSTKCLFTNWVFWKMPFYKMSFFQMSYKMPAIHVPRQNVKLHITIQQNDIFTKWHFSKCLTKCLPYMYLDKMLNCTLRFNKMTILQNNKFTTLAFKWQRFKHFDEMSFGVMSFDV